MRRRQLEIILSRMKTNPRPRLQFEEYYLDSRSASTLLYAALSLGDIAGKDIIDLGCGTGILSIGAAILGARHVVGVDIDKKSVQIAVDNMNDVGVHVAFIACPIECVKGHFSTTVMNPPFGSWKRGSDLLFLEKALAVSKVVYSLHKASERSGAFLSRRIRTMGGETTRLGTIRLTISHLYDFHQKAKYEVDADLYRTVVRSG